MDIEHLIYLLKEASFERGYYKGRDKYGEEQYREAVDEERQAETELLKAVEKMQEQIRACVETEESQ